jgi:hypothetical protein
MNKSLPDKWIRKAVYDAIDGMTVDGNIINCYDTNITQDGNGEAPSNYVLMTTQTNTVDKQNKCEWFWDSTLTLDCTTIYDSVGNIGSRLLVDNIADEVRNRVQNLVLDVASGLEVVWQTMSFPADMVMETDEETVYRKIIILELRIC